MADFIEGLPRALAAVSSEVRRAVELSYLALNELGVPHVLAGGLAIGAHGWPHAVRDVAYLVPGDRVFEGTGLVSFRPGIPIRVGAVPVLYWVTEGPETVRSRMQTCLDHAAMNPTKLEVVPSEVLIFMELKTGRAKDLAAVVELLKAGLDTEATQRFLDVAGDAEVLGRFERCVRMAKEEQT